MTEIGLVGLDTSHGEAFAEVLGERTGATISAVWDGGEIREEEYVESFCAEWDATRYEDPAGMVGAVDAAMVLAVDWERHRPLAAPFLEAGVPTLVDKPVAGTLADVEALVDAAGETPLFGGSAVPFHPSFATLPDAAADRTLHVAGYNDYFYYRVHVVDTARRIVNADWTRVTPVEGTATTTVQVGFEDGTLATLRFDAPPDVYATLDVADRTRTVAVTVDEDALRKMYERYLDAFLGAIEGDAPGPTRGVLDGAGFLLAVEAALAAERTVTRDDATLATVERPSEPFVDDYEPYY